MRNVVVAMLLAVALVLAACSASDPSALSYASHSKGATSGGSGDDASGGAGLNGGGNGGGGSSTPQAHGLPCDVDAMLAANCRQCHGAVPAFGASFSLVTWADLNAAGPDASKKVYQLVQTKIHDDAAPMPPLPNARVSAADMATFDAWAAAGAPKSSDTCTSPPDGSGGAPVVEPLSCTPDQHIAPASPYAMANSGEQYVCYGFDVTVAQKRHVIALAPKIDNAAIVHHLLLFQSPQTENATPTACSAGGSTSWSLIGGWAPGGKNIELPAEAGFPESGTTHWVLQVHYSNAKGLANQKDASGFDMCTTDQLRPNDAGVMAFGSTSFTIPARGSLNLTCSFDYSNLLPAVHVFSATPHMHLLGKTLSTDILPGGSGAAVSVVNQAHWDFQTQVAYPASNDIKPGDTVVTKCGWSNDTDSAVTFGENTTNEMCFSFLAYYPAIASPLWSWAAPSALANCQ